MVGRLVQHQQIRLRQQQPRQAQPRLFAAGELVGRLVLAPARKAQSRQHALDAARPLVATRVLEPVDEPRIGAGELVERLGVAVLFRHLLFHLAHPALHLAHRLEHALELLLNGQVAADVGILRQHADARPLCQRNHARIRLHGAADQAKQRRLAASIYADQPHPAAGLQCQRDVLQDGVDSKRLVYVLQGEQYHDLSSPFGHGAKMRIRVPVSCIKMSEGYFRRANTQ